MRIIFKPGGSVVVPIGKAGRQSCTTLPDSLQEARSLIGNLHDNSDEPFSRGRGDEYILNNPCELKYYFNGKLVAHLK